MSRDFEPLKDEYQARWANMAVAPEHKSQVIAAAHKIIAGRDKYKAIEAELGVPWFFVGLVHYREANCNFFCHLHNGDPLTDRTQHVPKHRPLTGSPPFTWHESTLDALKMRGLHRKSIDGLERMLFELEEYNGEGYRNEGVTSDYLWGWTNQHDHGRFVADHVYMSTAHGSQAGVAPVFAALVVMDRSISFEPPAAPSPPPAQPEPQAQPEPSGAPQQPPQAPALELSELEPNMLLRFLAWLYDLLLRFLKALLEQLKGRL